VLFGGALGFIWQRTDGVTLRAERGFYGVLRVQEMVEPRTLVPVRRLLHGSTVHGFQVMPPGNPSVLTGYYTEGSGVGLAFSRVIRPQGRRIGIVGLGVGTLSAYANPSDVVRFYEIDPKVEQLSHEMFSFLRRSRAPVTVTLGDARVSLEREAPQDFDVLVLDAFSSDAIPTHLLTREAFGTYSRHLDSAGVIAVHISNRHLRLEPVVLGAAEALDFQAATIRGAGRGPSYEGPDWVLVTRDGALMRDPVIATRSSPRPQGPLLLWTDERSSIWPALK
jgi:hypothetical protein